MQRKTKKLLRVITAVIAVVMLTSAVLAVSASAATAKSTSSVKATVAYTLKNLKYARAVQNFYIGSTYVYITQRVGSTTYLSRLKIDGKTAVYKDHMTLKNCGHGQSLDMYSYNDTNYLYVGCKAAETDMAFSLQIARIKYKAGATYDYTQLNRFSYMNYASKSTASLGTTHRVACGGNSKYTIFRVQTTNGKVTYSLYDTVALNKLLDKSKSVSMKSASARKACKYSFTQSGSSIVRPNGSFQGVDIASYGQIYISGGRDGQTPMLAKMNSKGSYLKLVKISNMGKREIEGVQCKNSKVYFVIVSKTTSAGKKNEQKICYVKESVFG